LLFRRAKTWTPVPGSFILPCYIGGEFLKNIFKEGKALAGFILRGLLPSLYPVMGAKNMGLTLIDLPRKLTGEQFAAALRLLHEEEVDLLIIKN
jgi:hypothetical protein